MTLTAWDADNGTSTIHKELKNKNPNNPIFQHLNEGTWEF